MFAMKLVELNVCLDTLLLLGSLHLYFPFTLYCFYAKISSLMPVLTIVIVLDCFYLLIFLF